MIVSGVCHLGVCDRHGTGQPSTQKSAGSLQKARYTAVVKLDVHFWPEK